MARKRKKVTVPKPVPFTGRFATEEEVRDWNNRAACSGCGEWLRPSQRDAHQCPGRPLGRLAREQVQEMIDASIARTLATLLGAVERALGGEG